MTASVILLTVSQGHLGAVHLGEMSLDLPRGQALGREGDHELVDATQAPLTFTHDLGLEGAVPITGHIDGHLADLGQDRLEPGAVAGIAAVTARRRVFA